VGLGVFFFVFVCCFFGGVCGLVCVWGILCVVFLCWVGVVCVVVGVCFVCGFVFVWVGFCFVVAGLF